MEIVWSSDFNPDGSRRKPPPSSMHGWLVKMRGTFLGDETLRSRGIKEMKEAALYKKRKAAKAQKSHTASKTSVFSFLGFGRKSKSSSKPQTRTTPPPQRPPTSRKTTHDSRKSGKSSKSSRPPPRPAGPSQRSSRPSSRRQDSHASANRAGQRRTSRK